MTIFARDLRRLMLRASADALVGAALRDVQARESPAEWLLLYPVAGGYAVVGVQELARRSTSEPRLLEQSFAALRLPASPAVDVEGDLAAAQNLLGASGYVVVLRDDEPYGVLVRPAARPPASLVQMLLDRAARWAPPAPTSAVLGVDEMVSKGPAQPAPASSFEPIPPRADRYVNTDFAGESDPAQPLPKTAPLQPGEWYFFRLNVGELEATSEETAPTLLPAPVLEQDATLAVVVFSESFNVERRAGRLLVPKEGPASVETPASIPQGMDASAELVRQRLLFRVRAPARPGRAELRANMYCNGMLIQSRQVTAVVGAGEPLTAAGAMRQSALDFNLSPTMAPSHLADLAPRTLSVMMNGNADGTHAFRLFSQQDQQLFDNDSATFEPTELSNLIGESRNALKTAAWGCADDWDSGWPEQQRYKFHPSLPADQLNANFTAALLRLAARGWTTYAALANNLGRGEDGAERLRDLMRKPGTVQLAIRTSANNVLPVALLYDSLLYAGGGGLKICDAFLDDLNSQRELIDAPCFQGDCPNRDKSNVVCPSGFWGFRHDIDMPYPAPFGPEMAKTIGYSGQPAMSIAYYDFPERGEHLERLKKLGYATSASLVQSEVIGGFQTGKPQLVYFYCHGVVDNTIPLLKIGSDSQSWLIATGDFKALQIKWRDTRPLVLINGCHTAALSPDRALSFVKVLIESAQAAGVIGTEITIFESLAQRFAETFLELFLGGETLARAIRRARLRLLAQRNPLGLVYLPFAYGGLKLASA